MMIKIFLVEDEIAIRKGIKNSIDWEKKDMSLWEKREMVNSHIR